MPTVRKIGNTLGSEVGGFPPQTTIGTLFCEQCSRYRSFGFKELRTMKDCLGILAEIFACLTCGWTRQWGARSG